MKAYEMIELVAQIQIQSGFRSFQPELTAISYGNRDYKHLFFQFLRRHKNEAHLLSRNWIGIAPVLS